MANNISLKMGDNRKLAAKYHDFVRQGHIDALNGSPYPRAYDTWDKIAQVNYENARLMAVNIKAAGLKPPVWRKDVTLPRDYVATVIKANGIVGSANKLGDYHRKER